MKQRLFDAALNDLYVHVARDETVPPQRMKRWLDKLTTLDDFLRAHEGILPVEPPPAKARVTIKEGAR